MSQGRFRSFFTGALVGAGLGILLAPKEGSETRNNLKKSFSLLVDTIKDIDVEESKAILFNKVTEIKEELSSIHSDLAKETAKEKVEIITEKCNELVSDAREIGAPVVEKVALEVKSGAVHLLEDFLEELNEVEEEEEKPKKTASSSTKSKKNVVKKTPSKKSTTANQKKGSNTKVTSKKKSKKSSKS